MDIKNILNVPDVPNDSTTTTDYNKYLSIIKRLLTNIITVLCLSTELMSMALLCFEYLLASTGLSLTLTDNNWCHFVMIIIVSDSLME